MPMDVIMPQMGESVAEGTVTKWLKAVGDKVERDEPLFEISTDKVDAEIPAPKAGYLAAILVAEGQTVEINTKVAVLSETPPSADAAAAPVPSTAPRAEASSVTSGGPVASPAAASSGSVLDAGGSTGTTGAAGLPASLEDVDAATLRRVRSSPLVRRIAADHQIDITRLQGTGLSGRVTKSDILEHIEAVKRGEIPPAVNDPSVRPPQPGPVVPTGSRSAQAPVSMNVPTGYLPAQSPRDTLEPMSNMRKKIADHMVWSKRLSPHVNSFLEIDLTNIVRLRARLKDEFLQRTGEKLTYMPFVMGAVISALKAFSVCNASIIGTDVIHHKDIHLGVAVALDWGLIVPVIRNADEKNLLGLTRSLNDLAGRARDKKLMPDEVAGGTFTITNPGSFGSLTGTPIINQPQVAIFGMGAINKKPWVLEGPDGDAIAIRHIMMASLAYDHRLVDGAVGAQFLNQVRTYLEGFTEAQLW